MRRDWSKNYAPIASQAANDPPAKDGDPVPENDASRAVTKMIESSLRRACEIHRRPETETP